MFTGFGDSKTAANEYQNYLRVLLSMSSGTSWRDVALAQGGWGTYNWRYNIDDRLAVINETPEFICWNCGVNDLPTGYSETIYKDLIRYVWRALHTKWSSAHIYVMHIWRRNYNTESDTVDQWYTDVQAEAEFGGYVSIISDERVWLENGDDGVTYTVDGVHPNAAGYVLFAQEWFADVEP